jgi:hypothetical protein
MPLPDEAARMVVDSDAHPARRVVVLDRVGQQVQQHLAQALQVGRHVLADPRIRRRVEMHPARQGERADQLERVGDHLLDADRLDRQRQLPGLEAGDVGHLVQEREQPLGCLEHHGHPFAVLGGDVAEAEQLAESEDGVQRIAQLVADPGQEMLPGLVFRAQRGVGLAGLPELVPEASVGLLAAGQHLPGQLVVLRLVLLQPDVLGDVLRLVNDVGEHAARVERRRVDPAPVAGFHAAALGRGPGDVIPAHRHRVGHAVAAHPVD